MRLLIGILIVVGSVIGGYMGVGGHLYVLWQPFEFVIILGAAMGAYVIGNTGPVLKQTMSAATITQARYSGRNMKPRLMPPANCGGMA